MFFLYLQALKELKYNIENDLLYIKDSGICYNIFSITGEERNYTIKSFCMDAFTEIYGCYNCFPVEGSEQEYNKYNDKFSIENNPYAEKRLLLLDNMIKYCEMNKKFYKLTYIINDKKFVEHSYSFSSLYYRAKNLFDHHKGNYTIKEV